MHLTVVYFGQEGLQEVKSSLEKVSRSVASLGKLSDTSVLALRLTCQGNINVLFIHREENFTNYTLVPVDEEFSRGRGLDIGAHAWKRGDVLMFFCDVDIHFSLEFLNTCRLHAAPSRFFSVLLITLTVECICRGLFVPIFTFICLTR